LDKGNINGAIEAFDTIVYNTRELSDQNRKNERKKKTEETTLYELQSIIA